MLGMDRHEWGNVHLWVSYAFIFFILLHMYLHRSWLIKVASKNHAWRMWVGLLAGLLIIVFFLVFPVELKFRR